jgi:hypothetical protein
MVLVAGACGSDANDDGSVATKGDDAVVHFLDETANGHTVHIAGTVRPVGPYDGNPTNIAGEIDFGRHAGWVREGNGPTTFTLRFSDDAIFMDAAVFREFPFFGVGSRLDGYDWVRVGRSDVRTGEPFSNSFGMDPANVLARLHDAEVVTGPEAARIGGDAVTHYRLRLPADLVARERNVAPAKVDAEERIVDVWVDGSDRLRRSVAIYNDDRVRVDYTGYGEPVDVDPPSGERVFHADDAIPKTDPDYRHLEPWRELAHGSFDDGMTWAVWKAKAGDGWACWTLETDPDLGLSPFKTGPDPDSVEGIDVEHRGYAALCDQEPGTSLFASGMRTLAENRMSSSDDDRPDERVFAAVAMGPVERATVKVRGGSTEDATIAPNDVVVWSGPAGTKLDRIDVALEDGHLVECTPVDYSAVRVPKHDDAGADFQLPDNQLECYLAD